jgi:hypothetical protein
MVSGLTRGGAQETGLANPFLAAKEYERNIL